MTQATNSASSAASERSRTGPLRLLSRSLSLRLLGIFVLTSLAILYILIELLARGLGAQWQYTIEPHLLQYAIYIQRDLGHPPDAERADRLARRLPLDIHIYHRDVLQHATRDTGFDPSARRFRSLPQPLQRRLRDDAGETAAQRFPEDIAGSVDRRRENRMLRLTSGDYAIYLNLGHRPPQSGRRKVSTPEAAPHRFRDRDELWRSLALLALVLGGSYWLIRRQLRPIRRIQTQVGKMREGHLNARIGLKGHSDLDELGHSIDAMATSIQAMLDAKRELLLAISHELRSPLTRARLAAEMLPASRNRQRLEEELSEMQSLIGDLIESERLQQAHTILNEEDLDLRSLLAEEYAAIVDGETWQDADTGALHIRGDSIRLRLMIRNLLNNAVLHGQKQGQQSAGSAVDLEVQEYADRVEISIRDRGPGIDPDKLESVTEPFVRLDSSRTRSTGGFGLGLTLARNIAEAHGGSLSIRNNTVSSGVTVTIVLPRR